MDVIADCLTNEWSNWNGLLYAALDSPFRWRLNVACCSPPNLHNYYRGKTAT